MWWRKNKIEDSGHASVAPTRGLSGRIHWMQSRLAETLNKKTSALSRRGQIMLLLVICLVFGGGSVWMVIWDFRSGQDSFPIQPKSITVPSYVDKTGDPAPTIGGINDDDMKKIKSIRHYLDSLQETVEGKRIFDSIRYARPGFMDSLREVERLYGMDTTIINAQVK
jgi:hypothetical protein